MKSEFIERLKKDLLVNFFSWFVFAAGLMVIIVGLTMDPNAEVELVDVERHIVFIAGIVLIMFAEMERHDSAIDRLNARIKELEKESDKPEE